MVTTRHGLVIPKLSLVLGCTSRTRAFDDGATNPVSVPAEVVFSCLLKRREFELKILRREEVNVEVQKSSRDGGTRSA